MIFVYTTIYNPVSSQSSFFFKIVEKAFFEALSYYVNTDKLVEDVCMELSRGYIQQSILHGTQT